MSPNELLGVILRAVGIYCLAGMLSDSARLLCLMVLGHSWELGDTLLKASIGATLYAIYAAGLLWGGDWIVRLVYRQRRTTSD